MNLFASIVTLVSGAWSAIKAVAGQFRSRRSPQLDQAFADYMAICGVIATELGKKPLSTEPSGWLGKRINRLLEPGVKLLDSVFSEAESELISRKMFPGSWERWDRLRDEYTAAGHRLLALAPPALRAEVGVTAAFVHDRALEIVAGGDPVTPEEWKERRDALEAAYRQRRWWSR